MEDQVKLRKLRLATLRVEDLKALRATLGFGSRLANTGGHPAKFRPWRNELRLKPGTKTSVSSSSLSRRLYHGFAPTPTPNVDFPPVATSTSTTVFVRQCVIHLIIAHRWLLWLSRLPSLVYVEVLILIRLSHSRKIPTIHRPPSINH